MKVSSLNLMEADLRLLSNESRKSESFSGHITGWLSGPEHPQIKESAERAMLKLRTAGDSEDEEAAIWQRKVIRCSQSAGHFDLC